jgi:hypothetical protein
VNSAARGRFRPSSFSTLSFDFRPHTLSSPSSPRQSLLHSFCLAIRVPHLSPTKLPSRWNDHSAAMERACTYTLRNVP